MTTHDDLDRTSPEFDRLMTAWFDAEARVREPDDLLDRTIVAHGADTSPPGLAAFRKVDPDGTHHAAGAIPALHTVRRDPGGSDPRHDPRHRRCRRSVRSAGVPAPFGPARNGSIFLATTAATSSASMPATVELDTRCRAASMRMTHPATSLRGSQVAFVRTDAGRSSTSTSSTSTAGPAIRISLVPLDSIPHDFAWSPDDRQLAWISATICGWPIPTARRATGSMSG